MIVAAIIIFIAVVGFNEYARFREKQEVAKESSQDAEMVRRLAASGAIRRDP